MAAADVNDLQPLVALEAESAQPVVTPRMMQQNYYEFLGDSTDITWDYYKLPTHRNYLEKKVGYALFGPPNQLPEGEITEKSTEEEMLNFQMGSGYGTKEQEQIQEMCNQIVAQTKYQEDPNDLFMSIVFVVFVPLTEVTDKLMQNDSHDKMNNVPVFRVKKCVPKPGVSTEKEVAQHNRCFIFIDTDCRVYPTWEEYIDENKLPKCKMVVPQNGIYNGDSNDEVLLSEFMSPAFSFKRKVEVIGDIAATTVSVGATGVLLVGMIPVAATAMAGAITVAAIGAGVTGIYSVVRGAISLVDRSSHDQTIAPTDAEARGNWMSIAGGSMGVVSGAATQALSAAAGRGISIGQGVRHAVNVINVGGLVVHGASTAYGIYQIYDLWYNEGETPTPLMIFQVTASVLFFTNSMVNMQTADTIIRDRQNAVLEEYQANLRSNRHRKMFKKMSKETVRQHGDEIAGKTEIIRSIKNINNKDDFFAGITRMNKDFNRNNVKISFSPEGTVLLNGQTAVDPMSFWAAGSGYQQSIYSDLPAPVVSANGVSAPRFQDTLFTVRAWATGATNASNVLATLFVGLSDTTEEGIINTISFYLSSLTDLGKDHFRIVLAQFTPRALHDFRRDLSDRFPLVEQQLMLFFGFVYEFIVKLAKNNMQAFENDKRGLLFHMEEILKFIIFNERVEEYVFREMIKDFKEYMVEVLARPRRIPTICKICNGQYYSQK